MTVICNDTDKALEVMMEELKDECLSYIKLMNQFELEKLTRKQKEDIFDELTTSISHLSVHSETMLEEMRK